VTFGSPADVPLAVPLYRQVMEIDNRTEETMQAATLSDTATPRYGYAPQTMFAATRAGAERRARETATAASADERRMRPAQSLIRCLAMRWIGSAS
jgi:putative effector of murein hydrolase